MIVELDCEGLRLDDAVQDGVLLLPGQPFDQAGNLKRVFDVNRLLFLKFFLIFWDGTNRQFIKWAKPASFSLFTFISINLKENTVDFSGIRL